MSRFFYFKVCVVPLLTGSRISFKSVRQVEGGWGSWRGVAPARAVHWPPASTRRLVKKKHTIDTLKHMLHIHTGKTPLSSQPISKCNKTHALKIRQKFVCVCFFASTAVRVLPVGGVMSPPVAAVAPVTTGLYQV